MHQSKKNFNQRCGGVAKWRIYGEAKYPVVSFEVMFEGVK